MTIPTSPTAISTHPWYVGEIGWWPNMGTKNRYYLWMFCKTISSWKISLTVDVLSSIRADSGGMFSYKKLLALPYLEQTWPPAQVDWWQRTSPLGGGLGDQFTGLCPEALSHWFLCSNSMTIPTSPTAISTHPWYVREIGWWLLLFIIIIYECFARPVQAGRNH